MEPRIIRFSELIEYTTLNKEADDTDNIISVLRGLYNTLKTDELRILELEDLSEDEFYTISNRVMCMPVPVYLTEGGGEFRVGRWNDSNVVIFTPDLNYPGGASIILK